MVWTVRANGGAGTLEAAITTYIGLVICAAAAAVFTAAPSLDINVSSVFFLQSGEFSLTQSHVWRFARQALFAGLLCFYVVVVAGACLAWRLGQPVLGLRLRDWFYLAATSAIGPWLLVNVVLKVHWGRWRPRQVEQFGGAELFTPPLNISGGCFGNCSFVSGEVASVTMSFVAVALLVDQPLRHRLYLITSLLSLMVIVMRVGQGGHFLSDSIIAAGLMIAVAGFLRGCFLARV